MNIYPLIFTEECMQVPLNKGKIASIRLIPTTIEAFCGK